VSEAIQSKRPALGVVLAGGRNTRYDGQAKALESVGGDSIAQRAIRAMREATERVVLVANEPETYRPLGLETRPDVQTGLGALGGIYTAVVWAEELGCRGALIAAGDMPFLSSALLGRLVEGAGAEHAVVPESDSHRGLEPLCAFYGTGCRPAIEAAIARDDLRVISFFPDVQLRTIPKDEIAKYGDPGVMFLNVNTPADRERAEALARGRDPRE
jgi:molybdopterin-guanine dinucleotide biosynthesis protein A